MYFFLGISLSAYMCVCVYTYICNYIHIYIHVIKAALRNYCFKGMRIKLFPFLKHAYLRTVYSTSKTNFFCVMSLQLTDSLT